MPDAEKKSQIKKVSGGTAFQILNDVLRPPDTDKWSLSA